MGVQRRFFSGYSVPHAGVWTGCERARARAVKAPWSVVGAEASVCMVNPSSMHRLLEAFYGSIN